MSGGGRARYYTDIATECQIRRGFGLFSYCIIYIDRTDNNLSEISYLKNIPMELGTLRDDDDDVLTSARGMIDGRESLGANTVIMLCYMYL